MSVLINSMDIPKSCSDCPLNYDEISCVVTGTRWWSDTMVLLNFDYTKERLYDCPLSEASSAQLENIRCYECKHGIHSGCGDVYICNVSPELVMEHTGDFYCGYAERKTDD